MEGGVRLRLLFEDRHLLNKSQKSEGLKRTWLLLKPQHKTISDLTSYLTHIFHLENTCPNGPLLSMDGFVLPPFESTHILKDKDLICVKKKSGVLSDFNGAGDCTNNLEMDEIVEKQPINTGVNLLANEEFNAETGGYQSESEDDHEDEESEDTLHVENTVGSKKRKASKKLQSSKRKKNKCTTTQICPRAPQAVENDVHVEQIRSSHHNRVVAQKSLFKKKKSSDVKGKLCKVSIPEIDERNICESMSSAKRRKGNKHTTPEICLEAPDDVENDVHVEQIENSHQNGVLTCVLKKKKSSVVKGKSNKESNPKLDERNNHLCQSMPSAERSHLQENGEGDVDVSDMPDGSKKFPSRSARRKKGKRQWLRERAIIEKRELQQRQSPEKDDQQPPPKNNQQSLKNDNLITSTKHQQSDQNSGAEEDVVPIVIRPGHIRFEPLSEVRSAKQETEELGTLYNIPLDVLSRLPTKILLSLKCVSKGWHRLISDRHFIRAQLKRTEPVAGLFFQERFRWCTDDIKSISFIPIGTEGAEVQRNIFDFLPEDVTILASSNGLVCCRSCMPASDPVIYVTNPTNKNWVSLKWDAPDKQNSLALAFDPFQDPVDVSTKFEVVRVRQVVYDKDDLCFTFEMYSSEAGEWRKSKEICQCNLKLFKNMGISIGKLVHWLTDGDLVLTFHLENELSQLLPVPVPTTQFKSISGACIGESDGRLHYVIISEYGLQVWVIEDYHDHKWELLFSITLEEMEEENPQFLYNILERVLNFDMNPWMEPLVFKDGLLFMRVSTKIYFYHIETRKMQELCSLSKLGPNSMFSPTVLSYSMSLVPLIRA